MLDMPPMNPPQEDERRDFQRLREKLAGQQGPAYWRSLGELADTEEFREFVAKEFPRQAAPLENGLDRRDFLKLLGASMALAGMSACARPPLPHERRRSRDLYAGAVRSTTRHMPKAPGLPAPRSGA